MKTTNKPSIRSLIDICFQRGLRDIVFSPGSRNAPLVIGFNADDRFTTYCIPDERVAGFFALGISLKKQIPCMLCCTSGSASLNYAPAICEAYYQNIPLLVLTADRPEDKIDQGVGQSMRQKDVYVNYINGSYQISSSQDAYSLSQNIRIVNEAISLSFSKNGPVHSIDRVLTGVSQNEELYRPDLLIYIGGQIISKKIIRYFSDFSADKQWYINPDKVQDTFESLTDHIATDTISFVQSLVELDSPNLKSYNYKWYELNDSIHIGHKSYFSNIAFSDLAVFNFLLTHIPDNSVLHVSNSSAIRYVQLFDQRKDLVYHANRGVSGIDGSTSTAMGYSHVSDKQNIFITGDISFFYDSNAFWHPHQPKNLKVILINNSGGGIFRIIDGPSSSEHLEQFFEAHHELKAEKFADTYGLEYFKAEDMISLSSVFTEFINNSNTNIQLLEVITPREENSEVLKDYFKSISKLS